MSTAKPTTTPSAEFREVPFPSGKAEPGTDRAIEVQRGRVMRERMRRVTTGSGFAVVITTSKLDQGGAVVMREDDPTAPLLAPAHELALTGEQLAMLGTPERVKAAVEDHRRQAAAIAHRHFTGLDLGESVLGARLGRVPPTTSPASPPVRIN